MVTVTKKTKKAYEDLVLNNNTFFVKITFHAHRLTQVSVKKITEKGKKTA